MSCKIDKADWPWFGEYPPIFKHLEISADMLTEPMVTYAKKYSLFEGKQKLLVSSFHAKDIVLSTTYVRFLQGLGVECYGLKKIIQFRSSSCLAPFIDRMTQHRRDGDRLNQPILAQWAKSAINNCMALLESRNLHNS